MTCLQLKLPCYSWWRHLMANQGRHYDDIVMGAMVSQITSLTIVYSIVYSGTDERKHQSSASLAFVLGIHRGPVNSPHKGPVTQKMFPFDDVIMEYLKSVPSRPKIWWRNSPVSQLFFLSGEQPEHCIQPVSYENITFTVKIVRRWYHILRKKNNQLIKSQSFLLQTQLTPPLSHIRTTLEEDAIFLRK